VTTSAEQMARLLALVPYLQRRGEVSVAEAAQRFGVPERTIQRDLQVLMYCGLPGQLPGEVIDFDFEALEDQSVIRIRDADFLPRPLRLGSREGAALLAALTALREGGDPDVQEIVDRTVAKVRAAVGEGAAIQVTPPVDATERRLAARLSDAIANGRQVLLRHAAAVRDEVRSRVVDPVAVSEAQGHLYLDAWDHDSEEQRLFRLDRVVDAEILDTAAETRPDPLDLSHGVFRPTSATPTARVQVAPTARWVTEYYPVEQAQEITDGDLAGGLEIVVPVAHPRWLVGLMLRLGPEARLVEPVDLGDLVRAAAARALTNYDTPDA
jgi:proteasome accessory factor C